MDNNQRMQAERYLLENANKPAFLSGLMQIIQNPQAVSKIEGHTK